MHIHKDTFLVAKNRITGNSPQFYTKVEVKFDKGYLALESSSK